MRIRKIEITNNKILGNVVLNFTDSSSNIQNNIIFAGENGTGKSTILNIIYEFSQYKILKSTTSEVRSFDVELSSIETNILQKSVNTAGYFVSGIKNNNLFIIWDSNISRDWNQVDIHWTDGSGIKKTLKGGNLTHQDTKIIFKSIFSDVEINYSPRNIISPTSEDIDVEIISSEKSGNDLATEITQLLIDIKSSDNDDIAHWVESNPRSIPPSYLLDNRMRRFRNAFSNMFPSKKLDRVDKVSKNRKIVFEENGKEMFIEELSSGEKQIVFRGSFLLKNKNTNIGTLVLIDEPEISMHPKWQFKIIEFYKLLFTSTTNVQESQIFFVTHSESILSKAIRDNDTLLICLNRNISSGIITATNINAPFILPNITSAEVNYYVFGIYSIDYHIQLFNYIPTKFNLPNNRVSTIDNCIKTNSSFNTAIHQKHTSYGTATYETISSYIRNEIHHTIPTTFSQNELRISTELLKQICT